MTIEPPFNSANERMRASYNAETRRTRPPRPDGPPFVYDEHEHEFHFVRTDEDWFAGDETDIYECDCGEMRSEYIPR